MGKTATSTKKQRKVSEHSRAARRAVSPSIDLDKSLKTATPAADGTPKVKTAKPHVLASQSPGITKKNKGKPMKRQQRERHLKALERASDNLDKLEVKVQKSVVREKKVNERKKGWEDLNEEKKKRRKAKNAFEALEDDEDESEETRKEREWVSDEEMPEVDVVERAPKKETPKQEVRVQGSIYQASAEQDEML